MSDGARSRQIFCFNLLVLFVRISQKKYYIFAKEKQKVFYLFFLKVNNISET